MPSHRGSIAGIDYGNISGTAGAAGTDNFQWSSFLGAGMPFGGDGSHASHHPIQLPLWMQESNGTTSSDLAFGEPLNEPPSEVKASPAQARSWGQQDQYKSPVPHNQYTSPAYQPLANQHLPPHHQGHRHSNSLGVPPSPLQQQQQQQQQQVLGAGTNFDSVLSDLGLPLDGLDGLFGDLPINAPTGQSNYSV